jgi:hypothetical protein
MVLDDKAQTVLADLGAGSSKETWAWFEQMHESVREEGIRFLAIGLVTNGSSTTSAILDWANALQNRVDYLVVKNKVAGEDFSYLFESEPANDFCNWPSRRLLRWKDGCPIFSKSSMIGA